MQLFIVMDWGSDDIPIGIFDDLKVAKDFAKEHGTSVYRMELNEKLDDKKEFFNRKE